MKYFKRYIGNLVLALPVGMFFFSIVFYLNQNIYLNNSISVNEYTDFYNTYFHKTIIFMFIINFYIYIYDIEKLSYFKATFIHFILNIITVYCVYFYDLNINGITLFFNVLSVFVIYFIIQLVIYLRNRSVAKKINSKIKKNDFSE